MPPSAAAPTFGRKASVRHARLRAAISGPSKSGKSYDALVIASTLLATLQEEGAAKGNGRIIVIDSENGRSEEQYGDLFDFDIYDLADFSPESYIDALQGAIKHDYSCIIIDQISHEWAGKGGALEMVQTASVTSKNSFTSWSSVTPRHNRFIEEISRCPTHILCTMRAKQDYILEANEYGKMVPRKVGLAPVQRDSTEYEFDIYGTVGQDHILRIETRGSLSRLIGDREFRPGKNVDDPGEVAMIGKLVGQWIAGRKDFSALASRDQINEIQTLGESLGFQHANWKGLLDYHKLTSLNSMTPEIFEEIKDKLTIALVKRAKAESDKKEVTKKSKTQV